MSEFAYSTADPRLIHRLLKPLLDRLLKDVPAGAKVLDLGCGNGSLLASFRDRGWELNGLDSSLSGIEMATTHFDGIRFAVGDVTGDLQEEFEEGTFDVVICTEVVEHVYNPRGLATNCFRLLKPGGCLVMSTPYHGYLKNLLLAVTGTMDRHFDPLKDHGHIKFWSRRTLPALLREQGFDRLEFFGAGRVAYVWMSMVYKAFRPLA